MKYYEVAHRLKIALDNANLKQQDLVNKSCVSKSCISHYINGSHIPSEKHARLMGQILGVNYLWLMGYDVPMNNVVLKEFPDNSKLIYLLKKKISSCEERIAQLEEKKEQINQYGFYDLGYHKGRLSVLEDWLAELEE